MIVYHGSSANIINGFIEPRQAFNMDIYSKGVYVTTDKITALLYSVNPIKSYFINHNVNLDASVFTSHIEPVQLIVIDPAFFVHLCQAIHHPIFYELTKE